jgi:acetyltransferase-like isoleucine patch superfamily enzyme
MTESPRTTPPEIHPTAIVEEGSTIGDGSRVWHHAHVRAGARVGPESTLGKNVFIDAGAVIGRACKIQNNVSIYAGVTLGDEVFVGPSAVFTNDRFPRATGSWDLVETHVKDGASIGANATIICGVVIGEWATVAAGAVVTHDVHPHELVAGNPARRMGWVCVCGRLLERTTGAPTNRSCMSCGREMENP